MKYIQKIGYKSSSGLRSHLGNIGYEPFHMHDDAIEIICVLDGTVNISDAAASYSLKYGDVHVFNINDPHRIYSDEDNIVLTTHIDFRLYRKLFPDLSEPPYFISDEFQYHSADIKLLRFYLADIYRLYSQNESDFTLEKSGRELFGLLVKYFQDYIYVESPEKIAYIIHAQKSHPSDEYRERMYRIVDYIYDHYSEKLTLKKTADMEYVSQAHLSRYIHECLGLTFSQQVSLARCEAAANLLANTEKTIDQIAAETGFCNRKHLATQFKRWYQKTPSSYRSIIKKDLKQDVEILLRPFDYDFAMNIIEMYLDEY